MTFGRLIGQAITTLLFAAIAGSALGQGVAKTRSYAAPNRRVEAVGVNECERGQCINWTFSSTKGYAHYPNGELAILTYRIDGKTVVIDRQMFHGQKLGYHYAYTGVADGDGLHGKFTSDDPRQPSGDWIASAAPPRPDAPDELHFCAVHCFVLKLDDGEPYDKPHYGSRSSGGLWIVERFDPNGIVIDRTDYDSSRQNIGGHAILTGRYSPNSSHVVNGILDWKYLSFGPPVALSYTMAWGQDIDTIPASDAEKASRNYPSSRQLSGPPPAAPQPQVSDAEINLFTAFINLATESLKHSD
jgi:hypothetical protein